MKNTIVLNLFGGPCAGKSTAAAGLFYVLKIMGYSVELTNEYAKELTWEDRHPALTDQLYILAKQNRKIQRLQGKVDIAISDSPLILGLNYTTPNYHENFEPLVFNVWNTYNNLNVYLQSDQALPYQTEGRNQSPEEAKNIDKKVLAFLESRQVEFTRVNVVPRVINPFENHVHDIIQLINKKKGQYV